MAKFKEDLSSKATAKELYDYLYNHPEYDAVLLDIKDKYNKTSLVTLTHYELEEMADFYDYNLDESNVA